MAKGTDTGKISDAMRADLESDYPKAWIWDEDGDTVQGRVKKLTSATTAFGNVPVLVLDVDGTDRSIFLFHDALKSQLARAKPVAGELIAIKQKGKVNNKAGTYSYMDYRVAVDRPDAETVNSESWDALTTVAMPAEAVDTDTDDIPF